MAVRVQHILDERTEYLLHPDFIWRICGEPASIVADREFTKTFEFLEAIETESESLTDDGQALIDLLEALVPSLTDKQQRRSAIALKRDIFGQRRLKDRQIVALSGALTNDQNSALSGIQQRLNRLHELRDSLPSSYDDEVLQAEKWLHDQFQPGNLCDGLQTVSPDLYSRLSQHFEKRRTKLANKSERSLDNVFLQYLLRTCLKTSPLSTFTVIYHGSWQADGIPSLRSELESLPVRRQVSLRRSLLQELLNPVIKSFSVDHDATRIWLNTTLRLDGDSFVLHKRQEASSLRGMTWGVGLEQVRLKVNPALRLIIEGFRRAGTRGMTVRDAARLFKKADDEEDYERLAKLIFSLLKIGALQTNAPPEQEDLIDWVVERLASANIENADELERQLTGLQFSLCDAESNDREQRRAAIHRVLSFAANVAEISGVDVGGKLDSQAVQEDTHVDIESHSIKPDALGHFREDLECLIDILPVFDMNSSLQSWLATRFVETFGESGECTDISGFLTSQMQYFDNGIIAPWTIASMRTRCDVVDRLLQLADTVFNHAVANMYDHEGEAYIDPGFARETAARIPERVQNRPTSFSFFGQVASALEGGSRFVVNQMLTGHSQLFARYLSKNADTAGIKAYLNRISRFGRYADVSGVFGFDANLHPRIADDQIRIAPYPANFTDAEIHDLDKMTLRYDDKCHRVHLMSEAGEPMDVFYFGLLNPGLMPQIHRLVLGFSSQSPAFMTGLTAALQRNGLSTEPPMFETPRVALGSLVLQRKAWNIAKQGFPEQNDANSLKAFRQIQDWRKQFSLPETAFIKLAPSGYQLAAAGAGEDDFDWENFNRIKMKPFYVDFRSPLIVRQFMRAINATTFDMVVTEVLPFITDQVLSVDGKGHVSELQVELTRRGVGAT